MRSSPVSLSNELCRSYLDLTWHFDPAAAAPEGGTAPGGLGRFDLDSVREHLAAFRAIEAGVEELEIEDTSDELDRTALLDDVRVTIFRLQHLRPHERDPSFWLNHLCTILWQREQSDDPAGPATLAALRDVPRFLRDAEASLREPPGVFIDTARALVGPAADLMGRAAGRASHGRDPEGIAAATDAEAALARFRLVLDTELSAHADEHAGAAGEDYFDRLLHHQYAVMAGAPEVWRYVLRLEEQVEGELRDLAHQVRPDANWRAALEASGRVGPRGDAAVELADAMERLRGSAERAGLPAAPEAPEVIPLPPHVAVFEPFARYLTAVGGGWVMAAERGAVRRDLTALAAEFGVAGAHALATRAHALPQFIRRRVTGAGLGGWGLYVLELLDQAEAWPEPAARLTIKAHLLFHLLLCRLDIGLHTRQLGLADAIRTLTERLPMTPGEALAAVRGVLFDPARAAGMIVTRRELLRLLDDRRAELGRRLDVRRHHEEVLGFGGLPPALIRWGLGLEA